MCGAVGLLKAKFFSFLLHWSLEGLIDDALSLELGLGNYYAHKLEEEYNDSNL